MSESGQAADADVAASIGRKDLSFRESRCAAVATSARIGRRENLESRCMPTQGQRPGLRGLPGGAAPAPRVIFSSPRRALAPGDMGASGALGEAHTRVPDQAGRVIAPGKMGVARA